LEIGKMHTYEDVRAMARTNYGYGRWDAPYWFIGPEQGMGSHEKDLGLRVRAWLDLGGLELNDCREFHRRIGEKRWHYEEPRVSLQRTWRPLILLLMTYLERPADRDNLRRYQRDRWGSADATQGETCAIELSGLAAPSLMGVGDVSLFLPERIDVIRTRIRDHRPELVVMYGDMQRASWQAIVSPLTFADDGVLEQGSTTVVCTPHPNKRGLCDAYWVDLGKRLRGKRHKSG
jgi:hypothetical protein